VITAFFIWFIGLFGVAPTPEDFVRMNRQFSERGHHLMIDFGGTRYNGTRWSGDDFKKEMTVGLGYGYLVDRKYNGVGLEVLGQSLGRVIRERERPHEFFVGGGLAYYPIQHQRIFMHAGASITAKGDVEALGRVGLGYRIMFFAVGVQPFAYAQVTSSGTFSWSLGARFEY
jgi:hypothetical protein